MFDTRPLQHAIAKLLAVLPGKNKFTISVSSVFPTKIVELLDALKQYDTVLLTQVDVWRYNNHPLLLEYFDSNQDRRFYIQTMGVDDFKIGNNVWVLTYNPLYWSREKSTLNIKSKSVPFGFSSLNNRMAYHRALLGVKLLEQQMFDRVMYSLGAGELGEYHTQRISQSPAWTEFYNQLPIKLDGPSWNFDFGNGTTHPAFDLAYANICTETETEYIDPYEQYPTPVITEKTWKPFLSCQIPVWLAAQGHMNYVRSFGFECFDELWPVNFDQMNTEQKVDAIVDLVRLGKDNIQELYFNSIDRIKHNWELVNSDKVEQSMLDRALEIIYN